VVRGRLGERDPADRGRDGRELPAGPFTNAGTYKFWAKVTGQCAPAANSPTITINVACPAILIPLVSTPAVSHFTAGYTVSWTGNPSVASFELQKRRT
jgi:hypothetical protein